MTSPRAESRAPRGITSVIRVSSRSRRRAVTAGRPASGLHALAHPRARKEVNTKGVNTVCSSARARSTGQRASRDDVCGAID